MSRAVWLARIPLFALLLAVWATSLFPSQTFANADAKGQQAEILVKNADPEFTLTLPPRYVAIKPTGDAIYAFGTADKTTGAVIAVYRLNRTIQPGTTDVSKFTMPDARRIDVPWQTLPLEVIAFHRTPDNGNGSKLAGRWVEVPLQHEAISILLFVPLEKEALADEIMHDFLSGLAGPSNWAIARPMTAIERGTRLGLGLALLLVLFGGPLMALRSWRRRLQRPKESRTAMPSLLRNFGAALAKPAFNKPGYLIRLATLVVVIIALGLGYIALTAAGVMLVFNQTLDASFNTVLFLFELACVIPLVILVGMLIRARRSRGRVLVDLGPDRLRTLFLAVGLLCLIAALMGGAGAVMNSRSRALSTLFLPILQLAIVSMFLVRGTGRVQITENGVWQNSSLLRWSQIGSYRWSDDSTELTLQAASPMPTKLSVPPQHKQAVQDLLMQRGLPQTSV